MNLSSLRCISDNCPDLCPFQMFLISYFSIWKNKPAIYWTELEELIK